jgi:16S rRNA (adenine1518-N6/adenine1519-N6)-dimethyltransferase
MDLCNISDVKALLGRHGFHFSKQMGQNFLIEDWVPREIVAQSQVGPNCGVLEIGPGIGPLTVQLAQAAGRVAAVELDRTLLPVLEETLAHYDNVEVISGDILKLDLPTLVEQHFPGLQPCACANLPYNITTPAITALIQAGCFARITVMIQREVALRICAQPGTSDYGAFSIFCQYHAHCQRLFDVPPQCFLPPPKVTSSVITLVPKAPPVQVADETRFFQVVRAAFAQRRKTLLNALSSAFSSQYSKEDLRQILLACNLPEDVRGEQLGIPEFAQLSALMPR